MALAVTGLVGQPKEQIALAMVARVTVENAKALLARVEREPEFAERLRALPADERRRLLDREGIGPVRAEHVEAAAPSVGGELSEEELEAVAGGLSKGGGDAIAGSAIGTIVMSLGAAAFAA